MCKKRRVELNRQRRWKSNGGNSSGRCQAPGAWSEHSKAAAVADPDADDEAFALEAQQRSLGALHADIAIALYERALALKAGAT